ncbi:hypothetical protein GCM10020331_072480 [Ectobacillus funiculus]
MKNIYKLVNIVQNRENNKKRTTEQGLLIQFFYGERVHMIIAEAGDVVEFKKMVCKGVCRK